MKTLCPCILQVAASLKASVATQTYIFNVLHKIKLGCIKQSWENKVITT